MAVVLADSDVDALLAEVYLAGLTISAVGDQLCVAPTERLTHELRDRLVQAKPVLLQRLQPTQFVTFVNGPTLPIAAVLLALDLERRGYRMSLDRGHRFQIEPPTGLSGEDRAAIAHWRYHLAAIVGYGVSVQ